TDAQSLGSAKRPRSPDSDNKTDKYIKRTRLDFKALPWNENWTMQDQSTLSLSPSLQKTNTLLENFSRDIKRARSSLLNCNRPLPQFPQSEWLNLLSGNTVDLDHVFSNIYTIACDVREPVEISKQLELFHSPSKPAKSVKTHGDWVIAWDSLVDATLFIFEHRRLELQLYSKHIQRYFASLPIQLHSCIINYDQAVQIWASQCHDLELSNFPEFTDLQLQWVHNPTSLASGSPSESRARQSLNRHHSAPCRRWNEHRCPNTAASCNYLHVCSKCSSGGHVTDDCSITGKK
ncbi:hypothetical protein BYT27DRAFT_7090511, partial [Phlegmacium glaucopus]